MTAKQRILLRYLDKELKEIANEGLTISCKNAKYIVDDSHRKLARHLAKEIKGSGTKGITISCNQAKYIVVNKRNRQKCVLQIVTINIKKEQKCRKTTENLRKKRIGIAKNIYQKPNKIL